MPSLDLSDITAFRRCVAAFEEDELLRSSFRRAVPPLGQDRALDLAPLLVGLAPAVPPEENSRPWRLATVACAASFVWPVALFALIVLILANITLQVRLHQADSYTAAIVLA